MKVDVITVEQATFRWWFWWSNWIDVCLFDYGGSPYLLQMRVSRTNAKHFKVRGMSTIFGTSPHGIGPVGDLTQMKVKP